MNRCWSKAIIAVGLVSVINGSVVYAETNGLTSSNRDSNKFQWREVAGEVSVSEYRQTYRHNKNVLRSAVKLYSENAAESMGLPKKAGKFAGGAAGVAASLLTNHDIRIGLNKKKSFAFEFRDPADNERAMFLNYKLKW